MNNNELTKTERRLSKAILDKAIISGNEYGWTEADFLDVVESARQNFMAIVGGQVQYVLHDGTCELYWLAYDPSTRKSNEDWVTYCNRTARECSEKFKILTATTDIEADAISSFAFLKTKKENGVDINKYQAFILYFDDDETDIFKQ